MDKFASLEAFVAVVESGSFSLAADRLGIAKSVVSRRISLLEKQLNSKLLHRTTRRLTLSEAGKHFYQRAVQILHDMDDAEQSVSAETTAIRGLIKLAAPLSFGLLHLTEAINDFLLQQPGIEINLDLNDREINLVEEGFDIAVRIGHLEDSSMVARRLGISRVITCASPDYLKQNCMPRHPDDLSRHVGLQYSHISYKQQWEYIDKTGASIQAQPQIRIRANNGDVLAMAARAGLGIISAPTFIVGEAIKSKHLIPVLGQFSRRLSGIYAIYPPGRLIPDRIRLLSDFMAGRFGDEPYWDDGLGLID